MTLPAKGYLGLSYGREVDVYHPAYDSDYFRLYKDKTVYHIASLNAGIELNTLNNHMYPSEGKQWLVNLLLNHEESQLRIYEAESVNNWYHHFTGSLKLGWEHYFNVHKNFIMGTKAEGYAYITKLYQDYTSTMVHFPAFAPTPSTKNYYIPAFRSPNYLAVGLVPIWMPFNRSQLRGDFYFYTPVRNVGVNKDGMAYYDGWFKRPQFIGEVAAVYNFPFASLSLYVNYLSSPKGNWNFGLNFGLFFQAPKLR